MKIAKTVEDQHKFDWENFVKGCLEISWGTMQEARSAYLYLGPGTDNSTHLNKQICHAYHTL
eukprot:945996-Ditylum_brightwellii.AAC.1